MARIMMNKRMKKITTAIIALISLFIGSQYFNPSVVKFDTGSQGSIEQLYETRQSGVMIEFGGMIEKLLSDDLKGSRHQRFIVKLDSGHTVLIAHNIDLAPRIPLQEGREVLVYGQYEWNDKGGVVHWTHKDPRGLHEEGWINYQGHVYE